MTGEVVGFGYLLGMFAVIASSAVFPVAPTGAAVSVGAALAEQDDVVLIVLVVLVGAAGAYVADLVTYGALRLAGRRADTGSGRVSRWVRSQRAGGALERVRTQIEHHEVRTLLLSRLVPAGRLPVLVAAAVGGYSWRRYAVADIVAATLWSVMYAASGLLGRAVFPEPWQGAVAAIVLVLAISLAGNLWARRRLPAAERDGTAD